MKRITDWLLTVALWLTSFLVGWPAIEKAVKEYEGKKRAEKLANAIRTEATRDL